MFFNSIDNTHNIAIDSLTIPSLSTGVLHSDTLGNVSSSQVVNSDVSNTAAIAYSKLNLNNSLVNADINTTAAIAYSKLNLNNSIVNADIVNSTIADNKLSSTIDVNATSNTIVKRNGTSGIVANDLTCAIINSSDTYTQTKTAALNNWGARVQCLNSTTGSDVKFLAGTFNISGIPRVYFGGNNIAETIWIPLFLDPGQGGVRIGYNGTTNPTESFAVAGTSLFVGTTTFSTPLADSNLATISTASKVSNSATTATSNNTASAIVARDANGDFSVGSIKFSAGIQNSAGTLNYASNKFNINENGIVKRVPNTRYAVIDAGGTINGLFGNYGVSSVINGSTGNYTVSFADWGLPHATISLFGANLGYVTWVGGSNTDIFVQTYNTSGVLSNIVSFTIVINT